MGVITCRVPVPYSNRQNRTKYIGKGTEKVIIGQDVSIPNVEDGYYASDGLRNGGRILYRDRKNMVVVVVRLTSVV